MRTFRIIVLMTSFLVIFGLLLGRLAFYQIVRGPEIAKKATAMRSQQIELKEYNRGIIWDRNRLPLTGTQSSTALYCLPQEALKQLDAQGKRIPVDDQMISQLSQRLSEIILDLKADRISNMLKSSLQSGEPFVRLASDLSAEETAVLQTRNIPGIVVAPVQKRYKTDGFMAHVVGTVEQGKSSRGVSGIERIYDDVLSNNPAAIDLVSVKDARGQLIHGLMYKIRREQDQVRGSVVLTIDKRVQESVEKVMNQRVKKGAVVVMDIESREVLAMASRPAFNPYQVAETIYRDQESALMNRTLISYHPGSLFKLVVAAAAIDKKVVKRSTPFHCSGSYRFNDKVTISCWKEEGHGDLTFEKALALSCNPVFIEVALRTGRDSILDYARRMHVCDETLIGYGSYKASSGININPGQPALGNAALGQQGVRLTPLQLTSLFATIADNGRWQPPSLVRYYFDGNGKQHFPTVPPKEQVISANTAQQISHMLSLVVDEGTGRSVAISDVSIAGKTGTSQTGQINLHQEEILDTWFGGYLPIEKPRWAVVVLVEEGVSGAQSAAPVFKEIAQALVQLYPSSGPPYP